MKTVLILMAIGHGVSIDYFATGDGEGGEFYSFTFAEEDNSGFSYVINGPEDCYLLMEGCWYLVKNPLEPPIRNE